MRRDARLKAARKWITTYDGGNHVRGYKRKFGVDTPCAIRELQMIGFEVSLKYIAGAMAFYQQTCEQKRQRRLKKTAETDPEMYGQEFGHDEHFAYIAGYTSGGFPYGATWEEAEALSLAE